ncbi:MAG: hypothetical protein PF484_11735 [Bacteroidales bacterium]|nr:hypothetical protein [Bacteroidales bacterium]
MVWCDGMGTGQELSRNLSRSSVLVFKLHMAFAAAQDIVGSVNIYPVMDGMYITSPDRQTIENIIKEAFKLLANDFIQAGGTKNMFMVRGGIAYGPVIHGKDIDPKAFGDYKIETSVKNAILLSPAMVPANKVESLAPPFGIYVDDSAKTSPILVNESDFGFISNLYQWWGKKEDESLKLLVSQLYHQIDFYLQKAKVHSVGMGFPLDRIETHLKLAYEYFGGIKMPNTNPAD